MKPLETAKIGKPDKKTKLNLDGFHESTTGFMMPNVPFIYLLDGKDEIKMNWDDFNKLNPMPKPTMGEAEFKLAWYFVPRRIIFNRTSEFMTHSIVHGLPDDNLFITKSPNFDYGAIMSLFINPNLGKPKLCDMLLDANNNPVIFHQIDWDTYFGENATNPMDFTFRNNLYKFTSLGIQVKTIMEQLGYAIGYDGYDGKSWNICAEPLLAFCKVMLDHYIPRYWDGYTDNFKNLYQIIENIDNCIDSNIGISWWDEFVELCTLVCFPDDYFTCSFNNVGGPNDESDPAIISGIDSTNTRIQGYNNANAILATIQAKAVSNEIQLTQQDLNTLSALDKEMKKNQIIGSKTWDRFLSRFGIRPDKALILVSSKISEQSFPIVFGDVVSTSDTLNQNVGDNLGAYAGKGSASLPEEGFFDFEAPEPGYLILIKTVIPKVAYNNCFSSLVLKLSRYDYWNEEYDGLGCEPVAAIECYSGYDCCKGEVTLNEIFGFLPRYASLKTFISKSSGKYSMPSIRNEMDGWTFTRWFDYNSTLGVAQISPSFVIGAHHGYRDDTIATQFDRIFYYPTEHNFNCYTKFVFELRTLKKPLYYYDDIIDEDDKSFQIEVGNKQD